MLRPRAIVQSVAIFVGSRRTPRQIRIAAGERLRPSLLDTGQVESQKTYQLVEGIMRANKLPIVAAVTIAIACAAAVTPLMPTTPVMAQTNPTMTNVLPDGGEFAAQGKIQALDPGALTLTPAPASGPPIRMTVAPSVDLTNVSVGDVADVHYKRSVTFVVGNPNLRVGQVPVTSTVEQVAQTPGGIGYDAAVVVGRVVKLNGRDSFDVVNANGGGIYTIS
jgi:hypothetical protein